VHVLAWLTSSRSGVCECGARVFVAASARMVVIAGASPEEAQPAMTLLMTLLVI